MTDCGGVRAVPEVNNVMSCMVRGEGNTLSGVNAAPFSCNCRSTSVILCIFFHIFSFNVINNNIKRGISLTVNLLILFQYPRCSVVTAQPTTTTSFIFNVYSLDSVFSQTLHPSSVLLFRNKSSKGIKVNNV